MQEEKRVGVGFGVLILRGSTILLGRRHEDPVKASSLLNGAGTWTMPGSKLHFGETFEAGAKREVLEETGLTLDDVRVISINNDIVDSAHFVTIGLLCESTTREPEVKEPDEITEWRWFDLDALPVSLYFPSAKIMENYRTNRFYTPLETKVV